MFHGHDNFVFWLQLGSKSGRRGCWAFSGLEVHAWDLCRESSIPCIAMVGRMLLLISTRLGRYKEPILNFLLSGHGLHWTGGCWAHYLEQVDQPSVLVVKPVQLQLLGSGQFKCRRPPVHRSHERLRHAMQDKRSQDAVGQAA